MQKRFIIGATGYIGKLLYSNAKKSGITYGTSSKQSNEELNYFSLDSPSEFEYGLIKKHDLIFLTAAISAPDVCSRENDRALNINVTGTANFISRVLSIGARVIFFSSDTVYGERNEPFDEQIQCNPAGEYAVMKYEIEQRFLSNNGFKSIRLSYVFSQEDKFTRYLIGCAQKQEEAELFHPFSRAIVHRDDVVAGALALGERWDDIPERIINFGGPQVLSRVEFAECLREAYLCDLRFRVIQPYDSFFHNRPRIIAMTSPVFGKILGRSPLSLCEATKLEFKSSLNRGV
jgi:nucleoside-diphosphate-sugar epimerase